MSLIVVSAGADEALVRSEPPRWLATFDVELPPERPEPAAAPDLPAAPPVPGRAVAAPVATDEASPAASAGTRYWLLEAQVLVPRRGDTVRFYRSIVELRDRAALDEWSTIEVVYAPPFERLELHRLRVRRDGVWSDRGRETEYRFARRETELADNILSGNQSLVLVVPDLRVGDLLEASWSVAGANAAFAGEHASEWRLAPAGARRRRFDLWIEPGAYAATRVLGDGPAGSESVEPGGLRHWVWDVVPPAKRDDEAGVPSDVPTEPSLQLSSFRDWTEVAAWGERLYRRGGASDALDRIAAPWRALAAADRLLQALRFVQGEIRYLAIVEGEHTLRPRPPETVLARRFGDCKDKTALLIDLLARLDIAARPVLVSSWRGGQLGDLLPSPGAFDHAIVVADLEGRQVWMDPTLELQASGDAASLWLPRYRHGLVLDPATTGLARIPDDLSAIPTREVRARYEIPPGLRSWKVEIETRHRGQHADSFRSQLTRDGREAIATSYLEYYRSAVPDLKQEPLEIRDDAGAPAVVTVERYRREDGEPGFETLPLEIGGYLPEIEEPEKRRFPVALRYPFTHQETLELHSPGTRFTPTAGRVDNRWFLFEAASKPLPDRMETTYRLELRADRVAASDAPAFAAEVAKVNALLGYSIELQPAKRPRLAASLVLAVSVGAFAFAARAARRRLRELAGALP